jgi:hypothetical protein
LSIIETPFGDSVRVDRLALNEIDQITFRRVDMTKLNELHKQCEGCDFLNCKKNGPRCLFEDRLQISRDGCICLTNTNLKK